MYYRKPYFTRNRGSTDTIISIFTIFPIIPIFCCISFSDTSHISHILSNFIKLIISCLQTQVALIKMFLKAALWSVPLGPLMTQEIMLKILIVFTEICYFSFLSIIYCSSNVTEQKLNCQFGSVTSITFH